MDYSYLDLNSKFKILIPWKRALYVQPYYFP